jgi:hypothetical protein
VGTPNELDARRNGGMETEPAIEPRNNGSDKIGFALKVGIRPDDYDKFSVMP